MSAVDWFRINNKCDYQLANRFAQREFSKFFITKDNLIRTDDFAAIPILLPYKSLKMFKMTKTTPKSRKNFLKKLHSCFLRKVVFQSSLLVY